MSRYYVRMEDLKEHGEEIKNYATDIVDAKIKELIKLGNELKWEGPAHDRFYESFTEKVKKIRYVAAMLEVYGKFMVMASEGYTDINDQMYKEFMADIKKKYSTLDEDV